MKLFKALCYAGTGGSLLEAIFRHQRGDLGSVCNGDSQNKNTINYKRDRQVVQLFAVLIFLIIEKNNALKELLKL